MPMASAKATIDNVLRDLADRVMALSTQMGTRQVALEPR
jgi:hypothetical protein